VNPQQKTVRLLKEILKITYRIVCIYEGKTGQEKPPKTSQDLEENYLS
tara:strand:+ start:445 stop:588 length:144 start_codon:yes stop_codon:yes gene_type:complete